ncbi:hypothetical protein QWY75_09550 [Pontixanthobacter aestiaquae]|uniref:Uncharacterized protein n=1 Tax=Pontixanthobacter aestiaquae TaxID=1509367 RepID=A0A844Z9K6_9SPHN|nr:hypothetical protein [Pontixanthobacter aestiaquae]MDN3646442.1 hypothetical protein [Pontixanthobacter aestiaquae]MXO82569.1 hypothetical protein [Pontixanthobacter aestiaquae]
MSPHIAGRKRRKTSQNEDLDTMKYFAAPIFTLATLAACAEAPAEKEDTSMTDVAASDTAANDGAISGAATDDIGTNEDKEATPALTRTDTKTDSTTTGHRKATKATISADLSPFGDGYPDAGDPCRRLGENDLTREWLDDAADLVGCPDEASAKALKGQRVHSVGGVVVLSVPTR